MENKGKEYNNFYYYIDSLCNKTVSKKLQSTTIITILYSAFITEKC